MNSDCAVYFDHLRKKSLIHLLEKINCQRAKKNEFLQATSLIWRSILISDIGWIALYCSFIYHTCIKTYIQSLC